MADEKKKKKKRAIQTYAFIDTNIFLDFYRGNREASLSLLEKLAGVKERIICTYQVEMEFLKNRQTRLKAILNDTKLSIDASLPAVLADSKVKDQLEKIKKARDKANKTLRKRIQSLLTDRNNDRVYGVLNTIFTAESGHVLTRKMKIRQQIKRLAWRRFILGYPPRKDGDTSIGDALNWEWIVHCAQNMPGRFYIVSRDGDYGCEHMDEYILNDQLMREFRDRVGQKSIVYTHKLSEALEALDVPVTTEEKEAEPAELPEVQHVPVIAKALGSWDSGHGKSDALTRVLAKLDATQNDIHASDGLTKAFDRFNALQKQLDQSGALTKTLDKWNSVQKQLDEAGGLAKAFDRFNAFQKQLDQSGGLAKTLEKFNAIQKQFDESNPLQKLLDAQDPFKKK